MGKSAKCVKLAEVSKVGKKLEAEGAEWNARGSSREWRVGTQEKRREWGGHQYAERKAEQGKRAAVIS